MRKIFKYITHLIITIFFMFCITGCNSNDIAPLNSSTADFNKTNIQRKLQLEEFYELSDFKDCDFEYISQIKEINNELFCTGIKNTASDNRCCILSTENDAKQFLNLDFSYETIHDACICNNTLYILHDNSISSVDLKTGKLIKNFDINADASVIQYNGNHFILKDFSSDILYFYDSDFNLVDSQNIPNLISVPEEMNDYRILCTDDRFYIAGDVNGLITLFVLDKDFNLIFSKDYSDLADKAYHIYDDKNTIILVAQELLISESYDTTITSYVDILDRDNGTVLERYEAPDSQFVFWNSSKKQLITKLVDKLSLRDLNSSVTSDFIVDENFNVGRATQSGNNIIFFNNTEQSFSYYLTHVSDTNETNEYELEPESRNSGITDEGLFYYTIQNNNSEFTSIYFKDSEFKTKEITIAPPDEVQIASNMDIVCCKERIYSQWYDYDNKPWISVYTTNGELINSFMFVYPITYNFITDGTNAYITYDQTLDGYGISLIRDSDISPVSNMKDIAYTALFDGDNFYSFYYSLGNIIYGYNSDNNTSTKILNYVDSGLSNISELFVRVDEGSYICQSYSENESHYYKLTKVSDEILAKLNSRKIIFVAGDTANWNETINTAITNFNHENHDYYIACKDYTEAPVDGIGDFVSDIINGDIPDIFISGGNMETSVLDNYNCLEALSPYISKSSLNFENFYPNNNNDSSEIYYISPLIKLGIIKSKLKIPELENKPTVDDFLEVAKKYSLKFNNCTKEELFSYIIATHTEDYINYPEKKCDFNSQTFIEMINYINNAIDENGNLSLCIYSGVADLAEFDDKNTYFDISRNGNCTSEIIENYRIAIYKNSQYKNEAWKFIESIFNNKTLIEDSYENGIPVLSNTNNEELYNLYAIDKQNISDILKDSRIMTPPDKNISNILYEETSAFFNDYITAKECADSIQKQITIYLNEH